MTRRIPAGVDPGLVGLVAAGVATVAHHAALHRWIPARWHVPANLAGAATLVALARAGGCDWGGLGLRPADATRGLRDGAWAALPVLGAVGAVAALPAGRRLLAHERSAAAGGRHLAYELAVRIPIGTAAAEEVIFRGALLGLLLRRHPAPVAVAWSSAVFGLWHVPPTVRDVRGHRAVGPHVADGRVRHGAVVAGVVAVTAGAGAALAALRLRTGSVAAPAVAHAALNVAAFAVSRLPAGA